MGTMSTSPNPRPAQSATGRRKRQRDLKRGKVSGVPQARREPPAPQTQADRLRLYLPSVAVPNLALALGIVALCFSVILIGGWKLAYLPTSIGQTWFALHGAPLAVDGVTLRAMPALPALGVAALVGSRIRSATAGRVSVLDLATLLGLTVAFVLLLTSIAWFMVYDASAVFPVHPPTLAEAFAYPLLVHLVGFAVGVRKVLWRALARRGGIPTEAVDAGAVAGKILRDLVLASGAVFIAALAAGYVRIGELVSQYPNLGVGGVLALVGLSVLYVPNGAVDTLAVLLGGSFELGGGAVSVFDATTVPYPPLPLFAAIPATMPGWAPVLMAIPAAVVIRSLLSSEPLSLAGTAAAATWAALYAAVIGIFTAGTAGAYGFVGVDPWALAMLSFLWVAIAGTIVQGVAAVRSRARAGEA